ncbi:hypothetical protein [Halomonas sp. MS1]|nr:hypothetical protein [Halomonas sp. MS1]UTD55450.1 hypothetical protein NF683_20285 [Halomonas sp. MS1]
MWPTNRPTPTATHAAHSTPRPARALNVEFFMHPCDRRQATPLLGWLVENGCMKNMRFHADLCAFNG